MDNLYYGLKEFEEHCPKLQILLQAKVEGHLELISFLSHFLVLKTV